MYWNDATDYINYLTKNSTPFLEQLKAQAIRDRVPIIRDDSKQFIETLLHSRRPERVLEIGTAIGYSSLVMASVISQYSKQASVTSIEREPDRYQQAVQNISRFDYLIELIHQEAEVVLTQWGKDGRRFEFIFMDGAKGQYLNMLDSVLALLPDGGILLSDNIFQDGLMHQSKHSIPRRQRTIHSRLRQYVWQLTNHAQLATSILPIGDGMTLSVKLPVAKKTDR